MRRRGYVLRFIHIFYRTYKPFNITLKALENLNVFLQLAVRLIQLTFQIGIDNFQSLAFKLRLIQRRLQSCIFFFQLFKLFILRCDRHIRFSCQGLSGSNRSPGKTF